MVSLLLHRLNFKVLFFVLGGFMQFDQKKFFGLVREKLYQYEKISEHNYSNVEN